MWAHPYLYGDGRGGGGGSDGGRDMVGVGGQLCWFWVFGYNTWPRVIFDGAVIRANSGKLIY